MKQLLILSGKGGTGKTTIASAFIKLAQARALADCDIDAPNLHLLVQSTTSGICSEYYGMEKACIDEKKCINCGICQVHCSFDSISFNEQACQVDLFACEGCGLCERLCPVNAISLKPDLAGQLTLYKDQCVFSTAQLKMGRGTSGKLVTAVKNQLLANTHDVDLAIIDGSPGIGCPVIASLSGADMVLIVAEASLSGLSDMNRIIRSARQFQVKIAVCVNKYDTNEDITQTITTVCQEHGLAFVGKIPFDVQVVKAINKGQSIVDIDCPAGSAVREVFSATMAILKQTGAVHFL